MELVRCPNCGAFSAARQRMCPQCETRLDAPPPPPPATAHFDGPAHICKHCRHSIVFPPVGQKLSPEDVWCTLTSVAKPADGTVENCFTLSFVWRREERLD